MRVAALSVLACMAACVPVALAPRAVRGSALVGAATAVLQPAGGGSAGEGTGSLAVWLGVGAHIEPAHLAVQLLCDAAETVALVLRVAHGHHGGNGVPWLRRHSAAARGMAHPGVR